MHLGGHRTDPHITADLMDPTWNSLSHELLSCHLSRLHTVVEHLRIFKELAPTPSSQPSRLGKLPASILL